MSLYHYCAHGLDIYSEIVCPELTPVDGDSFSGNTVQIRLGEVPESLVGFEFPSSKLQILSNQVLFCLDGIAKIYIHRGEEIIIQPAAEGQVSEYRQYVLGFGLGAILHQRGLLVLHGSSVVTPKGAMAFVGNSGAGKSTTAAAFQARGYRLLTDDLCRVDFNANDQPQVYPGLSQLKLFADSAAALSKDIHQARRLPIYEDKFAFRIASSRELSPVPLYAVCELNPSHDNAELEVQDIKQRKIFRLLLENTYGKRILRFSGGRELHFDHISKIAGQIKALRLTRPSGEIQLDEILDILLSTL